MLVVPGAEHCSARVAYSRTLVFCEDDTMWCSLSGTIKMLLLIRLDVHTSAKCLTCARPGCQTSFLRFVFKHTSVVAS